MAKVIMQIARCTARTFPQPLREQLFTYLSSNVMSHVSRTISTNRCLNTKRLYTEKHEWVTIDGNIGIVGISHYAQEALGDVVYAQLPDVGSIVAKEGECGALESVKAASELFSPVSGKVISKNDEVEKTPSLVNSSCYDKGWLFKVEIAKQNEVEGLMDENAYNEFLKSDKA